MIAPPNDAPNFCRDVIAGNSLNRAAFDFGDSTPRFLLPFPVNPQVRIFHQLLLMRVKPVEKAAAIRLIEFQNRLFKLFHAHVRSLSLRGGFAKEKFNQINCSISRAACGVMNTSSASCGPRRTDATTCGAASAHCLTILVT